MSDLDLDHDGEIPSNLDRFHASLLLIGGSIDHLGGDLDE